MKHEIQAILPPGDWPPPPPPPVIDQDIIKGFLSDASRLVGHASALYRPRDEAELAAILYHLNRAGTPVTVVARQTSTTGSSVPMGGAVVSMEKLVRIRSIDPERHSATAEGGILLGDFQRAVEAEGWLYPPDPTSRNESTLGASVACNASGARTFKYGPTRPYVRRLRVALAGGYLLEVARGQVMAAPDDHITLRLPDGTSRDIPCPTYARPAVKHAAGYHSGHGIDLIDLFIGSEGTLGVLTEVEVELLPLPERFVGLLATWPSEEAALGFVKAARSRRTAGELDPRCIEWLDANALRIVAEHFPDPKLPAEARAAVFFEQECTAETEGTLLEAWYELLMETGALVEADNGVIVADTPARQQLLYDLRHAVPAGVNEKAAHNGMPKIGTDLAVPDEALETMMAAYSRGVHDVPGALGPVESVRLMLELMGRSDPGEALNEATLEIEVGHLELLLAERSPRLGGHAVVVTSSPGERASAGIRGGAAYVGMGESGVSARLETRIQALWDRLDLPRSFEYATFGHIGNNHLHVNLLPKTKDGLAVARRLYDVLTRQAIALGGTVSAEHGIGKIKRKSLRWLLGDEAVAQMVAVKSALDPRGILGVGNLFEPGG